MITKLIIAAILAASPSNSPQNDDLKKELKAIDEYIQEHQDAIGQKEYDVLLIKFKSLFKYYPHITYVPSMECRGIWFLGSGLKQPSQEEKSTDNPDLEKVLGWLRQIPPTMIDKSVKPSAATVKKIYDEFSRNNPKVKPERIDSMIEESVDVLIKLSVKDKNSLDYWIALNGHFHPNCVALLEDELIAKKFRSGQLYKSLENDIYTTALKNEIFKTDKDGELIAKLLSVLIRTKGLPSPSAGTLDMTAEQNEYTELLSQLRKEGSWAQQWAAADFDRQLHQFIHPDDRKEGVGAACYRRGTQRSLDWLCTLLQRPENKDKDLAERLGLLLPGLAEMSLKPEHLAATEGQLRRLSPEQRRAWLGNFLTCLPPMTSLLTRDPEQKKITLDLLKRLERLKAADAAQSSKLSELVKGLESKP